MDAHGFEIVKIEDFDNTGNVWSSSTIDDGELYEYDEFGRITAIRDNHFDDETYMNSAEKSVARMALKVDVHKFKKVVRYDFTYDERGNLISSSYNGDLRKTFQYDDNDRLNKINRF